MKTKALIFIMLFYSVLHSQEIEWMIGFGGTQNDIAGNILLSENGDFYISGYFADDVNFNLLNGENILSSEFNQEYFFCKYNVNRELQWTNSLGAAIFGTPAITKTPNNSTICRYLGLVENFEEMIVVEKYKEDGSIFWSVKQDYLNTTNNIPNKTNLLFPSFNERCDLNSYDDPTALLNLEGVCLSQIYSDENSEFNGTLVNHTYVSIGSSTNIILSTLGESRLIFRNEEIEIGKGNIFEDTYDISTYFISLDSLGNYVNHSLINTGWSQDLSGIQNWYFVDKASSDLNFAYISGFTRGNFIFGDNNQFTNVPVVQKIGSNGNVLWSKPIKTINGASNQITSVNVTNDYLILSGIFSGTIDIDMDGISEQYINSELNGVSSFVAIYKKEGEYLKHFVYHDLSILDVALNSDNSLLTFGTYSKDNLIFETNSGSYNLPVYGLQDLFIQKINYLNSTSSKVFTKFNTEIFPNPMIDEFYIKGENLSKCIIYNSQGNVISEEPLESNISKLELSEKGIFFLKLISKDNSFEFHKVISN